MSTREEKAQVIEQLLELIAKSSIGILTDYRGIPGGEMAGLRRKLRESGIDYRVVKNTLARLAASKAGREELAGLFQGTLAVAFGYGEVTEPAKILTEYIRGSKSNLSIKGGFVAGRVLTPADVAAISVLPSKEVLLGKVLAGMQSPITSLVGVLVAPLRGFTGVLQARMKQLEGA